MPRYLHLRGTAFVSSALIDRLNATFWRRHNKNPCFKLLKVALNVEYAFGLAAVILNGLVIVIVVSKSPMQKTVSMLFTANMALGDFFVGVNAIFSCFAECIL